ncbi:MAG: hypothetical protein FWD03_05725, partial [Defluviitaleaceae bacterium]|nr:hypothetical protein [Defluviitaleaceae bacterium]
NSKHPKAATNPNTQNPVKIEYCVEVVYVFVKVHDDQPFVVLHCIKYKSLRLTDQLVGISNQLGSCGGCSTGFIWLLT